MVVKFWDKMFGKVKPIDLKWPWTSGVMIAILGYEMAEIKRILGLDWLVSLKLW